MHRVDRTCRRSRQEWLESRDNEDQEAIVETRDRLLAALDQSPELATVTSQLVSLLGSVQRQANSKQRSARRVR